MVARFSRVSVTRLFRGVPVVLLLLGPGLAAAESTPPAVDAQLKAVEERLKRVEELLGKALERIQEQDEQLKAAGITPAVTPAGTETPEIAPESPVTAAPAAPPVAAVAPAAEGTPTGGGAGTFEPGKGFVLARSDLGEVDFSVFSYVRYLNQHGLDDTYTDSFGRVREIDRRSDLQFQKVTLNLKGWILDPRLRYLFYTWTSNTSQGQSAQVVVAGNVSYNFNENFTLAGGIGALPTTRTTNWTFPNWLKVDHRTIADDYFRGSYTTGIWASGKVTDTVKYRVMAGNNLSQLGVDAAQLDNSFNTLSGAVWWLPTTGEYGPGEGFGDFEFHERPATLVGLHFTRSREDNQSQPGTEDPENSQIRISDGTAIFDPGAFGPGTQITKATYRMLAANAGVKYRGFSLDGEYYWRWVDNFSTIGPNPLSVSDLKDDGFQIQASAMLIPQTLQVYLAGSKIYGQYGDPSDLSLGVNWFPYQNRILRINSQLLYLNDSPVGYSSVPFALGGDGTVWSTDVMLNF